MKKQMIAVAVASAFAVPAMAQVTVSGMLESGYVSRDTASVKTNTIGRGFVGTPHFKMTGTEDLGGGLRASVHLQLDINASVTASDASVWANGTGFSVASIALQGAFGRVELGDFTPAPRDGGGVYRFMGDIGRLASPTVLATTATANEVVAFNSGAYVNAVQYSTPVISGLQANLYASRAGKITASAREATGDGYSVTGTLAGLRFSLGSEQLATTASPAGNAKRRLDTIAASYNLGFARVGVVNAVNKTEAATVLKSDATGLHIAAPVGSSLLVGATATRYKTSGTTAKNDVMTLGVKYDLSKRTNIQATYQTVKTGTTGLAGFATRGLDVNGRTGATTNGYGIQAQHNF